MFLALAKFLDRTFAIRRNKQDAKLKFCVTGCFDFYFKLAGFSFFEIDINVWAIIVEYEVFVA